MNNNFISLNISTLKLKYLEIGQGLFTKKAIYCTMNISQIIKDRRLLLGLTQQDLADYTELSLRIIKSIEAGNGNPTFSTLNKIAEILGLEIIMRVFVFDTLFPFFYNILSEGQTKLFNTKRSK